MSGVLADYFRATIFTIRHAAVSWSTFTFAERGNRTQEPPTPPLRAVMSTRQLRGDGSAAADAAIVHVDREADPWRWRCPNNHTRWVPTNRHVYCHSCARMADPGDGPEYFELLDVRTGETIDYARVELV